MPITVGAVTIRLSVKTAVWRSQVARVAQRVDGLVPVVKGNGYGFGRAWLAARAAEFCDTVAVGTVHELLDLPTDLTAVVLTPTLTPPSSSEPILTVGCPEHVSALRGWSGRVIVKIISPMQRYGGDVALVEHAREAGLDVVGVSIHPPLAGTADEHAAAIVNNLVDIDPSLAVWVSHLSPEVYAGLPATHSYRLRLGTSLWHGDKRAFHLSADVIDVRSVPAGARAGYRLGVVEHDGHLVMIGAGTANGVTTLDDGQSPFHFHKQRLSLHEAPHMHTSMAVVPAGDPLPAIGDRVDLQRPLTMTLVDEYEWL